MVALDALVSLSSQKKRIDTKRIKTVHFRETHKNKPGRTGKLVREDIVDLILLTGENNQNKAREVGFTNTYVTHFKGELFVLLPN